MKEYRGTVTLLYLTLLYPILMISIIGIIHVLYM